MGRFVALFGRPDVLAKTHGRLGWAWFIYGLVGAAEYLWRGPHAVIASSIPGLFFISVYANAVGHWSSKAAARVEVKQDEAAASSVPSEPAVDGP